MRRWSLPLVCLLLKACSTHEDMRRDSYVGTENGQAIYEYTVEHWPIALWSTAKLNAWVRRDGEKICPKGYREISRTPGKSYVSYSGPVPMPYTEVKVRVGC